MKTLLLICAGFLALGAGAAEKKIVFIAGNPSHGPSEHEHRAGLLLLQKCLANTPGVNVVVHSNDWPKDPETALAGADAIVMFATGGGGHPAIKGDRLKVLDEVLSKGAGFGTIHYAVEVPKDKGGPEFLRWQGGYFETYWSVNPHWDADFKTLPNHPITRGVKPFKVNDEWYYHMRFADRGVTPILQAVPPDRTRGTVGAPPSSHGGNPEVQKRMGQAETVMWAFERPNGGRGFGFTGAHFHRNWGNENFRKVVLNAILWIAKADVPPNGVECAVTQEDLEQNLDPKGQRRQPRRVENPARLEPFVSPTLPGK